MFSQTVKDVESFQEVRKRRIIDFWNDLAFSGSGATTWEALQPIERRVTEALSGDKPNLDEAESLTARALFLIRGIICC